MVNTDIPTDEETKKYLAGVKSATGLTYYDENISASRVKNMCFEGRQRILELFQSSLRKSETLKGIDDLDKELVAKGHVVALSISLGNSSPSDTKEANSLEPPAGSVSKKLEEYYDVKPDWKGEIVFTEKFQVVADALENHSERNKNSFESYKKRYNALYSFNHKIIPDNMNLNDSEREVDHFFRKTIMDSCVELLNATGISIKSGSSLGDLKPDVVIYNANGKALAICEIKRPGLSRYIKDGKLSTDDAKQNSILKEACAYLIEGKVDFCFISDFHTTIILQLDFAADEDTDGAAIISQKNDPPEPAFQRKRTHGSLNDFNFDEVIKKTEAEVRKSISKVVPFKYRIIESTDTECTLQNAFFSLVYYQYWLQQNSSDPIVKAQIEAQAAAAEKLRKRLARPKDEVVAEKTEIMKATSSEYIYPIHKNIDKARFEDPVFGNGTQWEGFDLLQGKPYTNQVYLFEFETLVSLFPFFTSRLSGNKPQGKVVLKLYDLDYVEDNFDLRKYWEWEKVRYCAEVKRRYFHEVECYERIREHNSTTSASRVNIPKVYDYGYLTFCNESSYLFGGFFILMEYLENQPETARRFTFKSGYTQIKALGALGISHNDITTNNIRIVDSSLFLFDFSHAKCADKPVNSECDLDQLEAIEDEFFSGDAVDSAICD